MQVYRHMDIGTAKPEPSVTARLPHHLISIVEADFQFNAGEFVRRADALVESIVASGGVPIVSGGTAFYLRNFALGLPAVPRGSPSFRKRLHVEGETRGWDVLYSELSRRKRRIRVRRVSSHTFAFRPVTWYPVLSSE